MFPHAPTRGEEEKAHRGVRTLCFQVKELSLSASSCAFDISHRPRETHADAFRGCPVGTSETFAPVSV